MPERDSTARVLLVAGGVALACSIIVSVAVTWLRPIQLARSSVEQNRGVLVAAGLIEAGAEADAGELVDRFLELDRRLVDLDAGRYVLADASMVAGYDYRRAAEDPAASREIAAGADLASLGRRPLLMPVYLRYSGSNLEQLILPVFGQGMWSTIHANLVLDGSLERIAGFYVVEHGETPGIGDRIENPDWLATWSGKRAVDADGAVLIRVGGGEAPAGSRVDGITGATVTAESVGRLVRYWLGPDGYGPFLDWLRDEA